MPEIEAHVVELLDKAKSLEFVELWIPNASLKTGGFKRSTPHTLALNIPLIDPLMVLHVQKVHEPYATSRSINECVDQYPKTKQTRVLLNEFREANCPTKPFEMKVM